MISAAKLNKAIKRCVEKELDRLDEYDWLREALCDVLSKTIESAFKSKKFKAMVTKECNNLIDDPTSFKKLIAEKVKQMIKD